MNRLVDTHGYYHITLSSQDARPLLSSNNERAFVITLLQDLLTPRLLISEIPEYKQLASCLDLLAFSIRTTSIQLVLFSIDETITDTFAQVVTSRLAEFQSEYCTKPPAEMRTAVSRLIGPHQALAQTVTIHKAHEDWEYDRYSSIGFYLHDRRGDWMRMWRVAQLYDNDGENYRALMTKSGRRLEEPALRSTLLPRVA